MQILAVLPSFLPVDDIRRRVSALLPSIRIETDFSAVDAETLEKVEVLVVTAFTPVGKEIIGRLKSVRFIQVASTGYDNVDLSCCRQRGIAVSNIQGANSKSVAEHVIMCALVLLRDLKRQDSMIRNGDWPVISGSFDLAGKVVGIIGMGRIGREVALRLVPFEASTIYSDIQPLDEQEERRLGAVRVELRELLQDADIITLHLPLTESTRGIISADSLELMKDGAIIINAARAELMDYDALLKYLRAGKIKAALDVYPQEPPDFSSQLFREEETVFTPHNAGVTVEAQQRILAETVSNVIRFVQGKKPLYGVVP
jgi:phosphoglycerate dehydrogenase-like enzyme